MNNNRSYQWAWLILGYKASSSQRYRIIASLFVWVPFPDLILYVNGLLLDSDNLRSHLKRLEYVLQVLMENLRLCPEIMFLLHKETKFVGYILSHEGISAEKLYFLERNLCRHWHCCLIYLRITKLLSKQKSVKIFWRF